MCQSVFEERVPCLTTSVDVQDVTSQRHRVHKEISLKESLHRNGRGVGRLPNAHRLTMSETTIRSYKYNQRRTERLIFECNY